MSVITVATVPGSVSGITVTADENGSAKIAWAAAKDDGGTVVTGYVVQQSCAGGSWVQASGSPTKAAQLRVTGLPVGKSCEFRVAALNSAGQGAWATGVRVVITQSQQNSGLLWGALVTSSVLLVVCVVIGIRIGTRRRTPKHDETVHG